MPKRVFTKEEKDHFRAFIIGNCDKMTISDIAKKLGIAHQTVALWLRKMRVKKKYVGGESNATRFKTGVPGPRAGRSFEYDSPDGIRIIYAGGKHYTKGRYVWEQNFGPVPKGMIVSYRDGDNHNFDPGNLMLITKVEALARNNIHRYPAEIKELIFLSSRVKRKIDEQSGKGKGGAVRPARGARQPGPEGQQREVAAGGDAC